MVTDEMVEKAVRAALRADIIPADDPKYEGVRINEYLSYTPAEAVELGVHLTQTTEDGKPRWHGFTDIMGDEYDDTNRAILRPVIRAALEAALSAVEQEPVAWYWEDNSGCYHITMDRPDVQEMAAEFFCDPKPLYAASPAPSVVVNALQMADETFRDLGWHDKYEATTAALTALSAQVQAVAGWQPADEAPRGTVALIRHRSGQIDYVYKTNNGEPFLETWRYAGTANHGQQAPWPEYYLPISALPAAPARQEGGANE